MKNLIALILLISITTVTRSQNLVLNGGFNQMTGCPTALSMLDSAAFWTNPTINGTPDYFHQCGNPFFAGVPVNGLGYQQPFNGEGYAGVHRWQQGLINYREYLHGELSAPLIAGQCYYFEMYISLANFSEYNSPDIAVLFSDTMLSGLISTQMMALTPQIVNPPGMSPDTAGWMQVSATYTATGGESFIIIGNFKDDATTNLTLFNQLALWPITYVYVDEVLLTPCVGLDIKDFSYSFSTYPNPVIDILNIVTNHPGLYEITLYDISMSKLISESFNSAASIDLRELAAGMYLFTVQSNDGIVKAGKIIKD